MLSVAIMFIACLLLTLAIWSVLSSVLLCLRSTQRRFALGLGSIALGVTRLVWLGFVVAVAFTLFRNTTIITVASQPAEILSSAVARSQLPADGSAEYFPVEARK